MHLKTLLNRVHPVKGFVYEKLNMVDDSDEANGFRIEVRLRARRGSRGVCSSCGGRGSTYDMYYYPKTGRVVKVASIPNRSRI